MATVLWPMLFCQGSWGSELPAEVVVLQKWAAPESVLSAAVFNFSLTLSHKSVNYGLLPHSEWSQLIGPHFSGHCNEAVSISEFLFGFKLCLHSLLTLHTTLAFFNCSAGAHRQERQSSGFKQVQGQGDKDRRVQRRAISKFQPNWVHSSSYQKGIEN